MTFWVVMGLKQQKMVQNDKKILLLHTISQEPYIIWLSFMVHMCKMIISPGVFFSFSKFWFSRLLGGEGGRGGEGEGGKMAKNSPKWQKVDSTSKGQNFQFCHPSSQILIKFCSNVPTNKKQKWAKFFHLTLNGS